jgi:Na+-translocating ferredoxin:NAD+ oxidoreductase RnfD subunit
MAQAPVATLSYSSPSPKTPVAVKTPLHSRIGVGTYLALQLIGAAFPLAGGFLVFGWRAAGVTVTVVCVAMATAFLLQRVGWRGRQVQLIHVLWLAVLLSLMLPAHLFCWGPVDGHILWPILPAAGITLALLTWLLGGLGGQRVSAAVVTLLILFAFFHTLLTPRYVLRIDRLFWGDLMRADPTATANAGSSSWLSRWAGSPYDSTQVDPTGDVLLAYTSAQQHPDRASLTMQMLIRDHMPPLENLIIAGQSSAIGNASAAAIILGGLFLLFRGLIDFRIPLFGTLSAMAALLILPVPIIITNTTTEWRWLAFREHYLGWPLALTFVNYEILASPLLLTLFYLANTPGLRPLTHRGRSIFAIALGIVSAIFILYASAAVGPYIALLAVSLATPTLDRLIHPCPLV